MSLPLNQAGVGRRPVEYLVDQFVTKKVQLNWKERFGPPVNQPSRIGFGTKLLRSAFAQQEDADATIEFEPDGVRCTVKFSAITEVSVPKSDARVCRAGGRTKPIELACTVVCRPSVGHYAASSDLLHYLSRLRIPKHRLHARHSM